MSWSGTARGGACDGLSGASLSREITYVGDVLDPATRTMQLRLELPNADRKLKPEMYATVRVHSEAGARRAGRSRRRRATRSRPAVCLCATGPSTFEARDVKLGEVEWSRSIKVLDGLKEGAIGRREGRLCAEVRTASGPDLGCMLLLSSHDVRTPPASFIALSLLQRCSSWLGGCWASLCVSNDRHRCLSRRHHCPRPGRHQSAGALPGRGRTIRHLSPGAAVDRSARADRCPIPVQSRARR